MSGKYRVVPLLGGKDMPFGMTPSKLEELLNEHNEPESRLCGVIPTYDGAWLIYEKT